jgi:hypothetical protein
LTSYPTQLVAIFVAIFPLVLERPPTASTVGDTRIRKGEQLFFVLAQFLDPVLNSMFGNGRQRAELKSCASVAAVADRRQHLDRSVWQ